jgi:hypothetical protein
MRTKSLNAILKHKFLLYGLVFLSLVILFNFYRVNSFSCIGAFGLAYYISCLYTKNKSLCLLFAIVVSTVILGCEHNLEAFREGAGPNCEENPDHPDCEGMEGDDDDDGDDDGPVEENPDSDSR